MKKGDENRFFETMKFRDVEKIRKASRILSLVFCVMMFAVALCSLFFAWSLAVKPTPVIAFDKEGRRMVFSETDTLEIATNEVRIHRFLTDFINKFDGISPNIDEDLKEAYNMLTPKFRQILLDKSVHNEKIDTWKNKNFETKFKITKLKRVKGSFLVGSSVTVEGLGETVFGNAGRKRKTNDTRLVFGTSDCSAGFAGTFSRRASCRFLYGKKFRGLQGTQGVSYGKQQGISFGNRNRRVG